MIQTYYAQMVTQHMLRVGTFQKWDGAGCTLYKTNRCKWVARSIVRQDLTCSHVVATAFFDAGNAAR